MAFNELFKKERWILRWPILKFIISIIIVNRRLGSSDKILIKGPLKTCVVNLPHLAAEKAEAQRCEGSCPKPHSAKIKSLEPSPLSHAKL